MTKVQEEALRRLVDRIDNLRTTNAALLEALELIVDDRGWETIDDARKIAAEAIRKATT